MFQTVPDLPDDLHTESLAIKVENLTIINLYIPPSSSCAQGYAPSLLPFLNTDDTLILGDLNAHDALWHSPISDSRGSIISDEIGNSNFATINEDSPTRLPSNGQPTSPDVTLASLSLLPYLSWTTQTELSSDHLPITISLETEIKSIPSENKTFINFRKADWDKFTTLTEDKFSKARPPTDVYSGEKFFRNIINKAANSTIPKGRIPEVFPNTPTETAEKITRRNELRKDNPQAPELRELNKEIDHERNVHNREKWRSTVQDINRKTDPSKLFKLIKHLNGGPKSSPNQAIKFKGKYLSNPTKIANSFNSQFSSVIPHKSSKTARKTTRLLKKNKLNNPKTFSPTQTAEAIKKCKPSKALGPDKISNLHLKHLGPLGTEFLTNIFNLSLSTSTIPSIWKTSTIIPLLKPKKPADESTSYRPVSLLCPGIKVLERLILPSLTEHLPVPEVQHGFRKHHSTVTALHDFNQSVADGFNKRKPANRTVLLQIDLSKAFVMVNHEKLLKDLNATGPPCWR